MSTKNISRNAFISDVQITTGAPNDGQSLAYNSTKNQWKYVTPTAGPTGPVGPAVGPAGPTGPTGPLRPADYIDIDVTGVTGITPLPLTVIKVSSPSSFTTTATTITVQPGTYHYIANPNSVALTHSAPSSIRLFSNGVAINESQMNIVPSTYVANNASSGISRILTFTVVTILDMRCISVSELQSGTINMQLIKIG
jgi:hypothetical protein